jgi:putative exporter of polyketide antibiotics
VHGRVLVFAANAIIFALLALLGLLLALQLQPKLDACANESPPSAACERTQVTATTSLSLGIATAILSPMLALIAILLHRRMNPPKEADP